MQSLYSIIKNTNVKTEGRRAITTDYSSIVDEEVAVTEIETESEEEKLRKTAESYEALAKTMIENARRQSEEILIRAHEEARNIEQQAFQQGYELGQEQGYKDAYEETIEKATIEADGMIQNAVDILQSAKLQYEDYLWSKQQELLQLAVNMAEAVLRKRLENTEGLEEMIFETLNNARNSETYVIRVPLKDVAELKERVADWKERLALKGEVFIIGDDSLTPGNAVVEKSSGKIGIGIDIGMESIRQALQ